MYAIEERMRKHDTDHQERTSFFRTRKVKENFRQKSSVNERRKISKKKEKK